MGFVGHKLSLPWVAELGEDSIGVQVCLDIAIKVFIMPTGRP